MGDDTDGQLVAEDADLAGKPRDPASGALEGKVERARRELTNVFDAVDELMFIHDRGGRILRANRACARRAGQDYRAILGKPYWEVFPALEGPLPVCGAVPTAESQGGEEIVTLDNRCFVCSCYPIRDKTGGSVHTLVVMRDVTAERQAQRWNRMLREVIEELSTELDLDELGARAVEAAMQLTGADLGAAVLLDPATGLLYHRWSTGGFVFERGLSRDEGLTGIVLQSGRTQQVNDYPESELALPEYVELGAQSAIVAPLKAGDTIAGVLIAISQQPGYRFAGEHIPVLESIANQLGVAVHRQALLDGLRASEKRFRHVVDAVPDILFTLDPDTFGVSLVSPAVTDLLGFTPEEMIAQPDLWMRLLHDDDREQVISELTETLKHGKPLSLDMRCWHRDGHTLRWFSGRAVVNHNAAGKAVEVVGIVSDITARKQAEEALAAERDFVTAVLDTTAALMVVMSPDGTIVRCNRACLDNFGYRAHEVEGRAVWQQFVPEEQRERVMSVFENLVAERIPSFHENEWVARDGSRRLIAWSNTTLSDGHGSIRYVIATGVDITGKTAAERSLRKANRALRTISACNEILVRTTDEDVLLHQVCEAIVNAGEFAAAWVGYTRNGEADDVQPMTQTGLLTETADNECVRGTLCEACPTRKALIAGRPVVDDEIDPQICSNPWTPGGRSPVGRSLIALPLMHHGRPLGVLVIYAHEANAFGEEEVALLEDLANDLVYGIRSLRTEHERTALIEAHEAGNERLQQTLVKTIESLAMALEKRDPYTSGHQQRVATLAVAIGEAMQLDSTRVEGIRLGALIHDVGKIYVPSEILNRPGRLTAPEFALIKSHSEVGFEIVKQVEFPWPVAQMIRQHHERLDGSGYPDGLRDEQIILEARVLAVADVVEAMTSHRPYRPGLGVEAALEEIGRHRGTLYDPVVVDTCVRLFREEGFSLEAQPVG